VLSFLAFSMVATFMALIMTRRLSALLALIIVPTLFGLASGHGAELGGMMFAGVRDLAPTGVMLLFAILYFGLMIDAGLFEPLIRRIVALVRGDPVRITVGTALLALLVSLDGDGTTTYMITVGAMLPLYRHMRLDVRIMACIIIMAGAVMNLLPWGGPTARAAAALRLDVSDVFLPLLPAMVGTAAWVILLAYYFGLRERRRLAAGLATNLPAIALPVAVPESVGDAASDSPRKPRLLWFNFALTAALIVLLVMNIMPLAILFMLAFAVALAVNYPSVAEQRARLTVHAGNALAVASLVFAAGIFTGILSGTKMVDAMANTVLSVIPPAIGPYLAPITAVLSMPFTFFISNDAFYFGMLPIIAKTAAEYGISAAEIARASLIGQQVHLLSPLVPSTYLLVGMAGIELGEHQRFTLKWALGSCVVMLVIALALGIFPLIVTRALE
jgi:citrate-Mg2+:H+ or citrate-Ca2+:H+ symporter, CitMHS family